MLSNRLVDGLGLLSRMADAAAIKASAHLLKPIRLARCDAIDIAHGFTEQDIRLESWLIGADDQMIIVSVFVTSPRTDGGECMAATGRFTFTTTAPATKGHLA